MYSTIVGCVPPYFPQASEIALGCGVWGISLVCSVLRVCLSLLYPRVSRGVCYCLSVCWGWFKLTRDLNPIGHSALYIIALDCICWSELQGICPKCALDVHAFRADSPDLLQLSLVWFSTDANEGAFLYPLLSLRSTHGGSPGGSLWGSLLLKNGVLCHPLMSNLLTYICLL